MALNCVANGRIAREGPFDELFVQPAAGDAGGALGVAAYLQHHVFGQPREFVMRSAFLGPGYESDEIRAFLEVKGAVFEELDREALLASTAAAIADQEVVGWFQGRMEFGPRALGARSILADPRNPENQDRVNLKIKFRESFRPFAPAVLAERAGEYFELDRESPFMMLVAQTRDGRAKLPATTHVDGSARVQTVDRETNPLFHDLLRAFGAATGTPVLINTSFNVRGEPIVCTPADALTLLSHHGHGPAGDRSLRAAQARPDPAAAGREPAPDVRRGLGGMALPSGIKSSWMRFVHVLGQVQTTLILSADLRADPGADGAVAAPLRPRGSAQPARAEGAELRARQADGSHGRRALHPSVLRFHGANQHRQADPLREHSVAAPRGPRGDLRARHASSRRAAPTASRGTEFWTCDPILQFKLSPDLDVLGERLSSDGFRTHEFERKRAGVYRILALGDSCTFGMILRGEASATCAIRTRSRSRSCSPSAWGRVASRCSTPASRATTATRA